MAERHTIETYGRAPRAQPTNRNIWPSRTQQKHMAERHTIETYGLAPHNRNIWPSATPTANQYKHMAQRHIIETYGRASRLADSFVWRGIGSNTTTYLY